MKAKRSLHLRAELTHINLAVDGFNAAVPENRPPFPQRSYLRPPPTPPQSPTPTTTLHVMYQVYTNKGPRGRPTWSPVAASGDAHDISSVSARRRTNLMPTHARSLYTLPLIIPRMNVTQVYIPVWYDIRSKVRHASIQRASPATWMATLLLRGTIVNRTTRC